MGDMSQSKRKQSRSRRGRRAATSSIAGRIGIPLWPVAVYWYFSQARLAIFGDVRVRHASDGAALIWLPELGEVRLEARHVPSVMTKPNSDLAAAVLDCDGAWDVLIGMGESAAMAVDEVLAAIEQAFIEEVGGERAQSIAVSVLAEHPGLANERVASSAVRAMVIGGPS
jgi:hypothetical protein